MTRLHLAPLDREPVSIRPPFHVRRVQVQDDRAANLADYLNAVYEPLAGVSLGSHDERIIWWLAGWDTPTVGTVVSLLHRARAAGPLTSTGIVR